ncbi:MAG: SEC-C domain-containing protein [Actinomycetota bacterium]|nr:SEC-C domain-containing protein [Actinomycetota bacterium]
MSKLGRNEPCHCGSGHKYKRCHLKADRQAESNVAPVVLPSEPFVEEGVLTGRPFIDTEHQGYRFRAVGGRLYYGPLDESFHEFVLRLLRDQLTHEWIQQELAKNPAERHLIVRWSLEKDELFASRAEDLGKAVRSVVMTGGVKALLSLGYDVYSLMHTGKILPKLVNRLKDRNQFQGARYEMAVAAIVARCGLKLQWLNAHEKHCEFVARDNRSGLEVGFEAKSYHREGVLHQPGIPPAPDEMKVKLGDHIKRALEQAPENMPFVVFNDLNLPPEVEVADWQRRVDESLKKSQVLEAASKLSIIFVTNFGWHFTDEREPPDGNVALIETPGPAHPLPKEITERLAVASSQYGYVPPKDRGVGLPAGRPLHLNAGGQANPTGH